MWRIADAEPEHCDVLVVGAGPTGLALAAQLAAFGVPFVLVDAAVDRVHESRALAVQPRTLEVVRPFGVSDELVARGNRGVRLRITAGGRVARTAATAFTLLTHGPDESGAADLRARFAP